MKDFKNIKKRAILKLLFLENNLYTEKIFIFY